jgi:hypothetical protein
MLNVVASSSLSKSPPPHNDTASEFFMANSRWPPAISKHRHGTNVVRNEDCHTICLMHQAYRIEGAPHWLADTGAMLFLPNAL